jgi:hypothetical protein
MTELAIRPAPFRRAAPFCPAQNILSQHLIQPRARFLIYAAQTIDHDPEMRASLRELE